MKRINLLALLALTAVHALAGDSVEEFVKPGTFTGKVAIVNQQKKIGLSEIEKVARLFAESTHCNFVVSDQEQGATIILRVVDDSSAPTMLLAPEDHWGNVNMAKLVDDLPGTSAKEKFLVPRARKIIIKALSILCGGGSSSFQGNIMSSASLRELDHAGECIPVDKLDAYYGYLKKLGVTRKVTATYEIACLEGWAPAPTNDIQRTIWTEIHAPPSKPMRIKYDADAKKPTVTK